MSYPSRLEKLRRITWYLVSYLTVSSCERHQDEMYILGSSVLSALVPPRILRICWIFRLVVVLPTWGRVKRGRYLQKVVKLEGLVDSQYSYFLP